MLTVERIFTLHDTNMGTVAQFLTGSLQCCGDVKIRHCRKFNGCVFQGSVLITDRAAGNNNVTGANIHVDTAASANTNKGIRANRCQFLHRNGCRRTANTGRTHGYFFTHQSACPDIVFTVHANMNRIIKMLCNCLTSSGIAGQEAVTTDIALFAVNMELHTNILHIHPPQIRFLELLYHTVRIVSIAMTLAVFAGKSVLDILFPHHLPHRM